MLQSNLISLKWNESESTCQNFYARNVHHYFKFQNTSQTQLRWTNDKKNRRNAFGCTLPFRVIRYARNRRAVTRVRRRARAYTWAHLVHSARCTSRLTIIGTRRHTDTPRRRYACCYETETESCMISIRSIFDAVNTRKNISPANCRVSIVLNNYGDHFRVAALSKSNISKLCRF